jgi:hypothetical protein
VNLNVLTFTFKRHFAAFVLYVGKNPKILVNESLQIKTKNSFCLRCQKQYIGKQFAKVWNNGVTLSDNLTVNSTSSRWGGQGMV